MNILIEDQYSNKRSILDLISIHLVTESDKSITMWGIQKSNSKGISIKLPEGNCTIFVKQPHVDKPKQSS